MTKKIMSQGGTPITMITILPTLKSDNYADFVMGHLLR